MILLKDDDLVFVSFLAWISSTMCMEMKTLIEVIVKNKKYDKVKECL